MSLTEKTEEWGSAMLKELAAQSESESEASQHDYTTQDTSARNPNVSLAFASENQRQDEKVEDAWDMAQEAEAYEMQAQLQGLETEARAARQRKKETLRKQLMRKHGDVEGLEILERTLEAERRRREEEVARRERTEHLREGREVQGYIGKMQEYRDKAQARMRELDEKYGADQFREILAQAEDAERAAQAQEADEKADQEFVAVVQPQGAQGVGPQVQAPAQLPVGVPLGVALPRNPLMKYKPAKAPIQDGQTSTPFFHMSHLRSGGVNHKFAVPGGAVRIRPSEITVEIRRVTKATRIELSRYLNGRFPLGAKVNGKFYSNALLAKAVLSRLPGRVTISY